MCTLGYNMHWKYIDIYDTVKIMISSSLSYLFDRW